MSLFEAAAVKLNSEAGCVLVAADHLNDTFGERSMLNWITAELGDWRGAGGKLSPNNCLRWSLCTAQKATDQQQAIE